MTTDEVRSEAIRVYLEGHPTNGLIAEDAEDKRLKRASDFADARVQQFLEQEEVHGKDTGT